MNKKEIMALNPGRDLDRIIAKEIFGLETQEAGNWVKLKHDNWEEVLPLLEYSTDISAAWQVVEKFKRTDLHGYGDIRIMWGNYGKDTTPKGPCAAVCYPQSLCWICSIDDDKTGNNYTATGETAPLAICRAALLAQVAE